MSTIRVRYIGNKPTKTDNVAGTDTVWLGEGDVQSVPEEAWLKLAKHPGVWQLASAAVAARPLAAPPVRFSGSAAAAAAAPAQAPAPSEPKLPAGSLKGTSHDAQIPVATDKSVASADMVARAAAKMGGDAAWNALEDDERYELVEAEVELVRNAAFKGQPKAEAVAKTLAAKKTPAAKKVPAKKAAKAKK